MDELETIVVSGPHAAERAAMLQRWNTLPVELLQWLAAVAVPAIEASPGESVEEVFQRLPLPGAAQVRRWFAGTRGA